MLCSFSTSKAVLIAGGFEDTDLNAHNKVFHPLFSEGDHVRKNPAEVAKDITEDQEEGFGVGGQDQISEEVDTSCCSEERVFLEL